LKILCSKYFYKIFYHHHWSFTAWSHAWAW